MLEQLKSKTKTPDFFTQEQKQYAQSGIEALMQHADIELQRMREQELALSDSLRETARTYEREYRDAKALEMYKRKIAQIDANPGYSRFKKKKEKNKLLKNCQYFMDRFAEQIVTPEIISEARMKEAEENLEFFIAQETAEGIEIEKAKAMFSPEEREIFKDNPLLSRLVFHQDLQTDHARNQKIVKGYLSDKPEERREFVLDVYRTVNEMPTDTFQFDSPAAFREKYAAMYRTCQRILAYRSVLAEGFREEQAALKENHPELVQSFEDRMEYFTKCADLFNLYRNHLCTGEYGVTEDMRKAAQKHGGDSDHLAFRQKLDAESERTGIRFGQIGYEERLE
jgi:hypothetical protein